jgi:hypothetical protein
VSESLAIMVAWPRDSDSSTLGRVTSEDRDDLCWGSVPGTAQAMSTITTAITKIARNIFSGVGVPAFEQASAGPGSSSVSAAPAPH